MSDQNLRQIARSAMANPRDRQRLTVEYIRIGKGHCLFWVGGNKPCEEAISSKVSYGVPLAHAHAQHGTRSLYLLAIDDLRSLEHCLQLKPHGILNLETGKHQLFNTPFQLLSPRYGPGTHYPQVMLGDGLYEVKTIPAGSYPSDSDELVFFRDCSRVAPPSPKYNPTPPTPKRTNTVFANVYTSSPESHKGVYLPYPKSYVILGISLLPTPQTARNSFLKLIAKTQFRFKVGTYDYVQLSSILVTSMPGRGDCDLETITSDLMAPVLSLPEEITLIPHQSFFAELIPTEPFTLDQPVELLLNFHGHYRRETM